MRRRVTLTVLFLGAFLSLATGLVLWHDNPTVDVAASDEGIEPAGEVPCPIAPWDAALNDNDDGPGGEHTEAFYEEVADECYAENIRRFDVAVVAGVLSFGLSLVGGVVLLTGAVAGLRRSRGAGELTTDDLSGRSDC